jgi:hypothetical protein
MGLLMQKNRRRKSHAWAPLRTTCRLPSNISEYSFSSAHSSKAGYC